MLYHPGYELRTTSDLEPVEPMMSKSVGLWDCGLWGISQFLGHRQVSTEIKS